MHADKPVLKERIDKRASAMARQGGMAEAFQVFDSFTEHNFEKGILQSIGYKEFYEIYQL